jgi:hypothetical protein
MRQYLYAIRVTVCAAAFLLMAFPTFAQVTPAAGYTPPDDTPSVRVGGVIYADYTYIQSPTIQDADKNNIHQSAFNVSRAYLNLTGNIFHRVSFRITPDVTRETGTGSSLNGSLTYRLKYAYAQLSLDDWMTHGSWLRFGIQQTPYVDYTEGIYRYRFQGTIFPEREGFLTSSDGGFSGHYNFAGNYGDVHAGIYNGEGYQRVDPNNQKAFQVRASLRPFPLGGTALKGLRINLFADKDHYVKSAKKERYLIGFSYEHPLINFGADYLDAKDRTSALTGTEAHGKGYWIWATPKLPNNFEILARYDRLKPASGSAQTRKRTILGLAYWLPQRSGVTTALMADYDSLKQSGYTPARAKDTRYGIKLLVNF